MSDAPAPDPRLHADTYGHGDPAVFLHGIFSWGLDTFAGQRELADAYRVLLVDRVGFGQTARGADEAAGWPVDGDAVIELLESAGPSHVVGHSYGAVVALLVAGRRPDLVRSLVLIEPLLFDLAVDRPGVAAFLAGFRKVFRDAPAMTPADFWVAFQLATGADAAALPEQMAAKTDEDWRSIENSRDESWAGDAPVDLDRIAAAPWPRCVVLGTAQVAPPRQPIRRAFQETGRVVGAMLGGSVIEFDRSGHMPQADEPTRFNVLLRDLWGNA